MNIDYESLRRDLIDYFGSAMAFFPQAVVDVSNVETASNYELEIIACQNGFDLNDYEVKGYRK